MRTAADLLAELNAVDESHSIEAKTGTEVGRSIMETVCAFANEPGLGGGYILLGIERIAGTLFDAGYAACGLDDPERVQSELITRCASMFNMPVRPRVEVEQVDGKAVVVAFVPEATATEKPVFLTNLGLPRGAFRRIGPTDHQGTEDDLIALYADHQSDTYDSGVVNDASLDDIDPVAIQEYRALREKVKPTAEELTWSDPDLLRALGCITRVDSTLKPTVAGILLFGTAMAIRRCLPMMRVDYIRVPGKEWVQDPDHRFDTVEIRAPLITAIRRATNAVVDDIPRAFSLPTNEVQSNETPLLPTRVVREAVVNAVMHRSYRIHGAIQMIRYSNRLEIRNPGHSLKAEEQLGQPGSETRNPRIAAVLHDVNIAETKGSGIRVIRELMQANNLMPPTLDSSRQPDQFVATFLFHHFLGENDLDWLASLTNERLSDEESRALVFVREVGAIDNAAYRELNRAETLTASTHLRRLRDLRLLEKKGSGNRTYYVPGPAFSYPAVTLPDESQELGPKSRELGVKSQELGPKSRELGVKSQELGPKSRELGANDTSSSTPDLPIELQTILGTISRGTGREDLRHAIREICAWAPQTSAQLSELLMRSQDSLVRDHLGPMIKSNELTYTIPELPNHPDQAYTAGSRTPST